METSAPKRRKTSPTDAVPTHGSAAGSTTPTRHGPGGLLPSRSQRIAQRPSPRPLPPPPEEEEEPIDPFRGRILRRSPPPPGVLPPTSNEEPELPPTPTQKGISDPASVNTSPAGIHNTPSKRARRSKALAEKLKSSPLKLPPLRPPELAGRPQNAPSHPVLTHHRGKVGGGQAGEATGEKHAAPEYPSDLTLRPHPARQVKEFDPDAEKKAIRDSLLAEVARLGRDIDFVSGENERLHRSQQGGKPQRELWTAKNKNNVLDLLRRHIPPRAHKPPSSSSAKEGAEELLLAALNPISFLPFSKADQALPAFLNKSSSQLGEGEGEGEEKDAPTSHYPIPLSADEELPYLQAFTPLTFTSKMSVLPRDDPDTAKPLQQNHIISVASSPPGLFAARIQMTVNTKNLSVSELSVPQLDPSAARELKPFVERIIHGRSNNSALTRNVSVLTWAMGEWVRVATRRARFWCAVERDLTSREGVMKCVKQMRRGRKRRDSDTDEDETETTDGPAKVGPASSRFSRAELARYLGKSSFDLDLAGPGDAPSIRIQWKIELDWTGEARSRLGLFVAAPARWHGRDKGRSLAGIPAMFDRLVGKRGEEPMSALRTVVALLAGDGKS